MALSGMVDSLTGHLNGHMLEKLEYGHVSVRFLVKGFTCSFVEFHSLVNLLSLIRVRN